jgi:hypothetical protein
MWKKYLIPQVIGVSFCLNLFALSYECCKDILRDGVHDTSSSQGKMDRNLAQHHQFCSISKEHNLNENNFDSFAKDYAKTVRSNNDTYGGSVGVSVGIFGLNANYSQSNNSKNLSQKEIENILRENAKKVIEYYRSHCGDSSYEDSLKAESIVLSRTANEAVVKAWRDCMLNQTGFFADLIPISRIDEDEKEIEYNIMVHWRSLEGTKITSIELRYLEGKVSTPYETKKENGGFVKTGNICDHENCVLKSGSSLLISLKHDDRTKNASLAILAKTDTYVVKSHALVLPKLVVPQPINIETSAFKQSNDQEKPTTHSDDEMRQMMNNLNLGQREVKHSDDFMRNMMKDTLNK